MGLEHYFGELADKIQGSRHGGLFGNPNELGMFANFALLIISASRYKKYSKVFLIIICVALSFLTFSKTAIVTTILLLLLMSTRKVKIFVTLAIISLAQLSFINLDYFINLDSEQQRRVELIGRLMSGEINEETTSERSILYAEAFDRLNDSAFMGNGFGTFTRLKGIGLGVHNGFLLVLGEGGIFAFIPLIIFFILFAFECYNQTKSITLLLSILICVFGLAIFPSHDIFENKQFIFFLAMIIYSMRYVWNSRRVLQ